jgi:hypothetical protein
VLIVPERQGRRIRGSDKLSALGGTASNPDFKELIVELLGTTRGKRRNEDNLAFDRDGQLA